MTVPRFSVNSSAPQKEELKHTEKGNCGNRVGMRTQEEQKRRCEKTGGKLGDGKNEWKRCMRNRQKLYLTISLSSIISKFGEDLSVVFF